MQVFMSANRRARLRSVLQGPRARSLLCFLLFVFYTAFGDNKAAKTPPTGTCTMLMSGFSREILMTALVVHYSSMRIFDRVVILWANSTTPQFGTRVLGHPSFRDRVEVVLTEDDLNARFQERPEIATDCVVIADDDMYIEEETIHSLYQVWRSHPRQLVGLWPRSHEVDGGYISKPKGKYSMVLTKFMLMHRKYLSIYQHRISHRVREYIRDKRNCEDIAMNYLVTSTSLLPPVYVQDFYKKDFGGKIGIWTRPGHANARNDCLKKISEFMAGAGLLHTTLTYVDGKPRTFVMDRFSRANIHDDRHLARTILDSFSGDHLRMDIVSYLRSYFQGL